MSTTFQIPVDEHRSLSGTLYEPEHPNGLTIQFNSAMAVGQYVYQRFAEYLAEHGFVVLTYDYRGMGNSQSGFDHQVSIYEWGEIDYSSVTDWLVKHFPNNRLLAVSHSLGGQLQGLSPNNHLIEGTLNIASGVGYWRHFSWRYQPKMVFAWYILVPLLLTFVEQVPGAFLGGVHPIPGRAVKEWSNWCRYPDYFCTRDKQPLPAYFQSQKRMRFVSISDDTNLAPLSAIEALQKHYSNAEIETIVYDPKELGVKTIGHFGFFSSKAPRKLWHEARHWLETFC